MNELEENRAETRSSPTRSGTSIATLAVVFAFVVMLCALLQASRVSAMYFTSGDDIYMGTLAERVRANGWGAYWKDSQMYAHWQGRPYFYFNFFFFILPYLTHSVELRTFLVVSVQMLTIGSAAWFFSLFLGRLAAVLFSSIVVCLLPLWPTVHPLSAHLVVYQMPILLFFGGMSAYVTVLRKPDLPRVKSRMLMAAGLGMLLASLLFYEALYLPFILIAVCAVASDIPSSSGTGHVREYLKRLFPILGVFAVWSAVYVLYRLLHPSTYEGSRLAPFHLGNIIWAVTQNALKSFPGGNIVNLPWAEANDSGGRWSALLDMLSSRLSLAGLLQAVGLGALVLLASVSAFGASARKSLEGARWLCAAAAVALIAGYITPLPLALSEKHAGMPWSLRPYLPGYFQFLAFCALASIILVAVRRLCGRTVTVIAYAIAALCLSVLTAAGSIANDRIETLLANSSRQWKLMDLLCKTDVLIRLPEGATVLAPTIWQGIDPEAWFNEDYWSRYVEARTRRKLRFVRTPMELGESISKEHPALFYCEHLWLPGRASSAVLLTSELRGTGTRRTAGRVTIVTDRDLPETELVYEMPTTGVSRGDISGFRYTRGAYVATVSSPGMVIGTAHLAHKSSLDQLLNSIGVEFSRGFSTPERGDGRYWRWADGPSGEGTLQIVNNSTQPVKVLFDAALMGGPALTTYTWKFRGETGKFQCLHEQVHTWELLLQPGPNELTIRSEGRRISPPGETRHLIFGLLNWHVRALRASE